MLHIGCHLSIAKGFLHMGQEALSIGADTFQFFTRNPRGGTSKQPKPDDVNALRTLLATEGFAPLVAHAPYTLNPCAARQELRTFARETLRGDLALLENLPGTFYNLHPGSHVGQGVNAGISLVAETLNAVLIPGQHTVILLETMSGKGSELGKSFEELREIIDRVEYTDRIGVCLDTCHVSDAGYDIINNLDDVLCTFDRIIGLQRLRAVHINDSLNPPGTHKDRHAPIGQGHIGLDALGRIVRHPVLQKLPFCLETPNDLAGYAKEIHLLRTLAEA